MVTDLYLLEYNGVVYVHHLVVLCLILAAAWIPTLFRGIYRLISPLIYSLAKLIRK